jgi:fructokinase
MIYTLGETVLDIVFKDEKPLTATPGGSMLNTSVSLGRLGLPVSFISEFGTDHVGNLVERFLKENGVNTQNVYRFKIGKTALAMAFLDKSNNASYDFYKSYPDQRLDIAIPKIGSNDILMFGSFYGISPEIRDTVKKIINQARDNGALVYYDPNFRKAHIHELPQLLPLIVENMSLSHVVRCSDEDMENIAGTDTPEKSYDFVKQYCANFIYTRSSKDVHAFTPNIKVNVPVKKIVPVSTIGAGDTFNAGIAYNISENHINSRNLQDVDENTWRNMINTGINFATDVCMSAENYISKQYAAFLIKKDL